MTDEELINQLQSVLIDYEEMLDCVDPDGDGYREELREVKRNLAMYANRAEPVTVDLIRQYLAACSDGHESPESNWFDCTTDEDLLALVKKTAKDFCLVQGFLPWAQHDDGDRPEPKELDINNRQHLQHLLDDMYQEVDA